MVKTADITRLGGPSKVGDLINRQIGGNGECSVRGIVESS